MPNLTELVADLPVPLAAKLRGLRWLARTGIAQEPLRAWAAAQPGLVAGPEWVRRAWWGVAAGEVVREYLYDRRRRAAALALVDGGDWSREIDVARGQGGVVLVTAHVGPPKLLMNVLLARSLPLFVWTNRNDMPPWLPQSTTAVFLDPRVESERSALLVRSALHVRRGGVLLGAADFHTGARLLEHPGLGPEPRMSLGLPALCRKLGVPTFLVMALWRGERVRIESMRLEAPDPTLSDDEWHRAWIERYAEHVERATRSDPENLRVLRGLAGGAIVRAVGVGGARALRAPRES